jgi:hypothetical protein
VVIIFFYFVDPSNLKKNPPTPKVSINAIGGPLNPYKTLKYFAFVIFMDPLALSTDPLLRTYGLEDPNIT